MRNNRISKEEREIMKRTLAGFRKAHATNYRERPLKLARVKSFIDDPLGETGIYLGVPPIEGLKNQQGFYRVNSVQSCYNCSAPGRFASVDMLNSQRVARYLASRGINMKKLAKRLSRG